MKKQLFAILLIAALLIGIVIMLILSNPKRSLLKFITEADSLDYKCTVGRTPILQKKLCKNNEQVREFLGDFKLIKKEECLCEHMDMLIFNKNNDSLQVSICDHCFDIIMQPAQNGKPGIIEHYKMPEDLYQRFKAFQVDWESQQQQRTITDFKSKNGSDPNEIQENKTKPDAMTYETHSYSNFSILLPSEFKRKPMKGDSNVLSFETDQNHFLIYERCVPNKINLSKMDNLQVIGIIFQSSAFYPKNYSNFYPEIIGDSPTDWITFKKKDSNSSYKAFFRVVERKNLNIPKTISAQLVYYETKRESPGSYADSHGNQVSAPWVDTKCYAYVIDSGAWKYVFRVGDNMNENTLNSITKGIMEFKEISEPNNLD